MADTPKTPTADGTPLTPLMHALMRQHLSGMMEMLDALIVDGHQKGKTPDDPEFRQLFACKNLAFRWRHQLDSQPLTGRALAFRPYATLPEDRGEE